MILCTGCPTTYQTRYFFNNSSNSGENKFLLSYFFGILAKKDKTFFKNSFLTMILCTGCPTTYQTRHFFNNSSNSGENKFFLSYFFGILAKKDKTFFLNSFLTMILCTGCPTTYQTRYFFNNSSNSGENKFLLSYFLAY